MLIGTNLQYANSFNNRIVLETIRLEGPLSRIEISRRTQLTAQTVTNITKKLMKAGLVYEANKLQEGRGAPSIMLEVNKDAAFSIGLDFDKDHLTGVLVDLHGNSRQRINHELNFPSPEDAIKLMAETSEKLITMEGVEKDKVWGVGVGLPGPLVVSEGSKVTNAVNPQYLPGWENVQVVKILEKELELPVYLENNASAAAIGERWYGAGKHKNSFFYIFLGAGMGGGVVINGQLYPGFSGNAGELGYMPVVGEVDSESMFAQSHLGMYFSLPLLFKKLQQNGYEVTSAQDLEDLYHNNNEILHQWVNENAERLAPYLLTIEYLIDPEVIFLGGRLPEVIIEVFTEKLTKRIPELRVKSKTSGPDLLCATAGLDTAALGVATIPLYTSFAPLPKVLMKRHRDEPESFKRMDMGV